MFRFTIRELVMLTLIVGLVLAIWIAQLQFTALQNEIERLKAGCSGSRSDLVSTPKVSSD